MLNPECYYAAGDPPSDVMLAQTGLISVGVSWTAPSATPALAGYRGSITHVESSFSQTLTRTSTTGATVFFFPHNDQYGDYSAEVMSLYVDMLPGLPAEPAMITVRGEA